MFSGRKSIFLVRRTCENASVGLPWRGIHLEFVAGLPFDHNHILCLGLGMCILDGFLHPAYHHSVAITRRVHSRGFAHYPQVLYGHTKPTHPIFP